MFLHYSYKWVYKYSNANMRRCMQCGGRLTRVHRSFLQRLRYVAIFACAECRRRETRCRFTYRFGQECCCPRCGTNRLSKLKKRDGIDPMASSLWNLAARVGGGQLYHCWLCRLQFYDRRPLPEWHNKEPEMVAHKPARSA